MVRLKSRRECCVNGFQYVQPETGWNNLKNAPDSQWDFNGLCRALQEHRLANPRFGLPTDLNSIAEEVDEVNAMRMMTIQGAESYYVTDTNPPKFSGRLRQLLGAAAAGSGNRIAAGMSTLADWLGAGGKAVPFEQANERAAVCVKCPQNQKGDWTRFFTVPASDAIRKQLEQKNNLKLQTLHDQSLGVCAACLCPLQLKTHTPIKHILDHMPDSVLPKLDKLCWITSERKNIT